MPDDQPTISYRPSNRRLTTTAFCLLAAIAVFAICLAAHFSVSVETIARSEIVVGDETFAAELQIRQDDLVATCRSTRGPLSVCYLGSKGDSNVKIARITFGASERSIRYWTENSVVAIFDIDTRTIQPPTTR